MVKFIGMGDQPHCNFTKIASWSRASKHLVNPIGIRDQLKWNNHAEKYKDFFKYLSLDISSRRDKIKK